MFTCLERFLLFKLLEEEIVNVVRWKEIFQKRFVEVEGGEEEREGLQRRKRVTRLHCEVLITFLRQLQHHQRIFTALRICKTHQQYYV